MKFKHFKNFMKDMGEWKNYKKNFYADIDNKGITPKQFWKNHIKQRNAINFLGNSFYFHNNEEGFDYWKDIEKEWRRHYSDEIRIVKR